MNLRFPRKLAACLLGLIVCAAINAQTRPSCSQFPAAEREAARERGVCIDLPRLEVVPAPVNPLPGVPTEPPLPSDDVGRARIWIPNFVGRQYRLAYTALTEKYRMRVVMRQRASSRPKGEVVDQDPHDVRVPRASVVTLYVSDNSLVEVPPLQPPVQPPVPPEAPQTPPLVEPPPAPPAPPPAAPKEASPSLPAVEPVKPGGLSPWWLSLAALPVVGAAAWWLRARPKQGFKSRAPVSAQPHVSAQFAGPAGQPQVASLEGPPLRMEIEVSSPRPSARPSARLSQEHSDE